MFIERLLNSGPTPLLEQSVKFAAQRAKLLTEDVANVDTPGFVQKDLDVDQFQQSLLNKLDQRSKVGTLATNFEDISSPDQNPTANILFHDRNNRSMEQLMAEGAKNTLFHNTMIELLRKQISQLEMALKEHVS